MSTMLGHRPSKLRGAWLGVAMAWGVMLSMHWLGNGPLFLWVWALISAAAAGYLWRLGFPRPFWVAYALLTVGSLVWAIAD